MRCDYDLIMEAVKQSKDSPPGEWVFIDGFTDDEIARTKVISDAMHRLEAEYGREEFVNSLLFAGEVCRQRPAFRGIPAPLLLELFLFVRRTDDEYDRRRP